MSTVYLVVGVPGSGKTWVCSQLTEKFHHVSHDAHIGDKDSTSYVNAIIANGKIATRPILAEAPFSISQIKDPLEKAGLKVVPVFIIEPEDLLGARYIGREGKPIPRGHLTRQVTYQLRAKEWKSFTGGSSQVLAHLQRSVP